MNKKRIATLTTCLTTLLLGLCFAFNSNNSNTQYMKSEAAMDVEGLEKITRSNLNTLVKGDMVYLITGNTNYGIGGFSRNTYGYKQTELSSLLYFEVMDVTNEYEVLIRYAATHKYINVTQTATGFYIDSDVKSYLSMNEDNHLYISSDDKDFILGRSGDYLGLYQSGSLSNYPTVDDNCLYMYKDTGFVASMASFTVAMTERLICDGGTTPPSTEIWNDINNIYNKLSVSDKNTLKTTDKDEKGDDTEQALAKYDFIIKKYYKTGEYADFIGRVANGKIVPDALMFDTVSPRNGNSDTITITIITMVSVMTLVSFTSFFLMKRKHD